MGTRVQVLKEVKRKLDDGETLCLQQVFYDYESNGNGDLAYRFIRRNSKGHLKAQRGQAALPNLKIASEMIAELEKVALKITK